MENSKNRKFTLICIDDEELVCQFFINTFGDCDKVSLRLYRCPDEWVSDGKPQGDIAVCDWNFPQGNLKVYLNEFNKSRLIIFSGSHHLIQADCLAIVGKAHGDGLLRFIQKEIQSLR